MKKYLFVFVCILLVSCGGSKDTDEQEMLDSGLFASTFEDRRCFRDLNESVMQYFRYTIGFDANGHINFGAAYYSDESCNSLIYRENGRNSTYPYSLGGVVDTSEGNEARILLFPDPEMIGEYGSVFVLVGAELCFAKDTVSMEQDSISFTPVDNNGDFSGLEIDYLNCLDEI